MQTVWRRAAVVGCLALAFFLGTYTTDREFINLRPGEGPQPVVALESNHTYVQAFIARRRSITRIGLYLKPTTVPLPRGTITLSLQRDGQEIFGQSVSADFIDAHGVTQVRMPPLVTVPGERLQISVTVSPEISGRVAAYARNPDGTFNAADVPFVISGVAQPAPLAHQVYAAYRPTLAVNIAVLLIAVSILTLFPWTHRPSVFPYFLGVVISGAVTIPLMLTGVWKWELFLAIFFTVAGSYMLLRAMGASLAAAMVGSFAASLTTWWALQALGGREKMLLIAILPWLGYLRLRWRLLAVWQRGWCVAAVLAFAALYLLYGTYGAVTDALPDAALKDIFLDPYQVSTAQKISGSIVAWNNYGSYTGVFVLLLAAIGMAWRGWRYKLAVILGLLPLLVIVVAPQVRFFIVPVPHTIILTTLMIAFFSAWGLEGLRRYLPPGVTRESILRIIAVVILLDLLFVLGTTLEEAYLL